MRGKRRGRKGSKISCGYYASMVQSRAATEEAQCTESEYRDHAVVNILNIYVDSSEKSLFAA